MAIAAMCSRLLRERICQPSETAVSHAGAEVLALYVRGADMLRIGAARDAMSFTADALCGAVALLAFRLGT